MKKFFGHISYANVVSTLALIVALSGAAYAANTAAKNSVVSKSIKNGEVKAKDVGSNAVGDAAVRDAFEISEPLTLLNGWETPNVASVTKTNEGVVYLDGDLNGPDSSSSIAFTLPEEFRPSSDLTLQTPCESQGTEFAEVTVGSDGNFSVSFFDTNCPEIFSGVELGGISFVASPPPLR